MIGTTILRMAPPGRSVEHVMSLNSWQPGTLYLSGAVVSSTIISAPVITAIGNSGFESGSTGWTLGTGWSIALTSAFSGQYAATNSGVAGTPGTLENNVFASVSAGKSITIKCFVDYGTVIVQDGVFLLPTEDSFLLPSGTADFLILPTGANVSLGFRFYNSAFELISTLITNQDTDYAPDVWKEITATHIAPSNSSYVRAFVDTNSTAGTIKVDNFSWNLVPGGSGIDFIFKAVQTGSGVSGVVEPIWPVIDGGQIVDNEVTWEAVTATTVTWQADSILTSGDTEPTWPTVTGAVVSDGNIAWETVRLVIEDENCPHTREVAIAGSKIFAGDEDITRFSATLNPRDWTTPEDAGFLATGLQQKGQVGVTALGVYRGNLCVWNQSNFQIWQVDPDPSAMALLDSMEGIGSGHHKAVQPVSNDLFFLAALGVRTVGIAAGSTNLATGDSGVPIDVLVQSEVEAFGFLKLPTGFRLLLPDSFRLFLPSSGTVDPLATYYPSAGQYWLAFPPSTVSTPGDAPPSVTPGTPPISDVDLPFASEVTAWWDFEEAAGDRSKYYSKSVDGNSLGLEAFNLDVEKWSPGIVDDGVKLRESGNKHIRRSGLELVIANNPWSAIIWFDTLSSIDAGGYILSQWSASVASETMGDRQWRLRINAAGNGFEFSIITGITDNNTGVDLDTGDIGLSTLTRYMLVITHDPDTDLMSLYINAGTPVTAAIVGGATNSINISSQVVQAAQLVTLGFDSSGLTTTKTSLNVDLVSVWNTSLTALNIVALYNSGNGYAFESLPGQVAYNPGMMMYNRGGYFATPPGNGKTFAGSSTFTIAYFRTVEWTGDVEQVLYQFQGPTGTTRTAAIVHASDASIAETRNRVIVRTRNSAGAVICKLMSNVDVCDDKNHVIFYSFNGVTGDATFIIDGVDADETGYTSRVAPTIGALETGSSTNLRWGASVANTLQWGGYLGFTGLRDTYLTNWSDFMTGNVPKQLDHSGWTEFGGSPHVFHDAGAVDSDMHRVVNRFFTQGSNLPIGPEQPPEWSYTSIVIAEGSGDAWVDGDTIQIVSGDQQTAVLFLYVAGLVINGHNGFVHKFPFGTALDNATTRARTVRNVVRTIDRQSAGLDPDVWGWTDNGTGTKETDYDHDLDTGKSRLINLTGSGAVSVQSAQSVTIDDNITVLIIDALEVSTSYAAGPAVDIYNPAGDHNNVTDETVRGRIRVDKTQDATNWIILEAAGNDATTIPFGTPTRIWMYTDAHLALSSVRMDTSTRPEGSLQLPQLQSPKTNDGVVIKHVQLGNSTTTKLGYFLQAQLRMRL